jgi:hypothetical protein
MEDASFADRILARLSEDFFNKAIMSNLARPHFVERMIAITLEPEWRLTSADWAGWDLQCGGCKVEVKQSAALQTWSDRMSRCGGKQVGRFDIRERAGHWADGITWNAETGRQADIYIFAWHGGTDLAAADQRLASQWEFFVIPECNLPNQKTIGLARIRRMTDAVRLDALRGELEKAAREIDASPPTRTQRF